MSHDNQERFLGQLPLAVARLYLRSHNAKTPLERYLAAYYLWEASLKLLATTAITEFAELEDHDPAVEERLHNLARPSTGHWWEFARLLVPLLAERGDDGFANVQQSLFGGRRDDLPRAASLDALLREELEGKTGAKSTVRLSELFDRLVAFRNRELGHGAAGQQSDQHYDRLGRVLLLAMGEILQRIDIAAGRTLIYVSTVQRQKDGSWQVERLALRGETARRLDPVPFAATATESLPSPDQVYLQSADSGLSVQGPSALKAIHPLMLYEPETSEVFFLNGRRGKKQADYLCYTSGNVRREGVSQTQCELLARVLRITVNQEDIDAWSTQCAAEEPNGAQQEEADVRTVGEFELCSLIGRGGMGEVYRAWQPSLGREVALKCLIRAGDPKSEARFAREIRALGKVERPHLVKIFTAGAEDDQWFYAMELIQGADLECICRQLSKNGSARVDRRTWQSALSTAFEDSRSSETRLAGSRSGDDESTSGSKPASGANPLSDPGVEPEASVAVVDHPALHALKHDYIESMVEFTRQSAEAAHALHEVGVVHRDIKPGNIMIDESGKAVLMDLGLAKLAADQDNLTRTRQFVGTLCYASPEQVLSAGSLDRRSDVYSLGATLCELLTLRPPFKESAESSTYEMMLQIQQYDPDSIRKENPAVPRDLEAIVNKCMEKDPKDRYQTAQELADDLQRFRKGDSVVARHVGPVGRFVKRCRRRPAATATAAVISALTIALAILAIVLLNRPEKMTDWQVAIESYPGSADQWWFDDQQLAGRMLPVARARLARSEDEAGYLALYDTDSAGAFLQKMIDDHNVPGVLPIRTKTQKPLTDPIEKIKLSISELDVDIADTEGLYQKLQGPTDAATLHTLALLQHRLALLNDQAEQQQSKIAQLLEDEVEKKKAESRARQRGGNTSNRYQQAKDYYQKALNDYPNPSPPRTLCQYDDIQLRLNFSFDDDAEQAASDLRKLNAELEKESIAKWKSTDAFKVFRIATLCQEGSQCRSLAKMRNKMKAGDAHDYFIKSQARYEEARTLAAGLAHKHKNNKSLAAQEVYVNVRLGWLYMDQWSFDDAKDSFKKARKLLNDDDSDYNQPYSITHGYAMALRYAGQISKAKRQFEHIEQQLTDEINQSGTAARLASCSSQLGNSLERYADCLPNLARSNGSSAGDRKRSEVLQKAFEANLASPSARIGCKLIIALALERDAVAAEEFEKIERQLPAKASAQYELHYTIAMEARKLNFDPTASLDTLRGLVTADAVAAHSDRESLEMRLLAWQLLMQHSSDEDKPTDAEAFQRIYQQVDAEMNRGKALKDKDEVGFLAQYKQIYDEQQTHPSPASAVLKRQYGRVVAD